MQHEVTSRGFKHMEPLEGEAPGPWRIRVNESPSAVPSIWICVKGQQYQPKGDVAKQEEVHTHLTLHDARLLRDQLDWLIDNHYLAGGEAA